MSPLRHERSASCSQSQAGAIVLRDKVANQTHELNLQKELIGYADEISVPRGATIAFKVSTDAPHYDAAIVRLIHGDANGPGFKEEVIEAEKRHSGRKQLAHSGSYGIVPAHP